jgi:thioredoxin-related protein
MTKKMKFLFVFFLLSFTNAKVTPSNHAKLSWMNMDELTLKMKSEPKPVLIDLYTDWCYWCKVMEKKTYNNSKVISYINDHFYAVKLNAESKENVQWKNKYFSYNNNYQLNEFAMYVTSGEPGFPTTVVIPDEKSEPIAVQGFLEPKEIEPILKYYGEGAYKTESYSDFKSTFKASW